MLMERKGKIVMENLTDKEAIEFVHEEIDRWSSCLVRVTIVFWEKSDYELKKKVK